MVYASFSDYLSRPIHGLLCSKILSMKSRRAQFHLATGSISSIVCLTFHCFLGPAANRCGKVFDILLCIVAVENQPDPVCSLWNNREADRIDLEPCQLQMYGEVEVMLRLGPDRTDLTDKWQSIPVILLVQRNPEKASIISLVPYRVFSDLLKK